MFATSVERTVAGEKRQAAARGSTLDWDRYLSVAKERLWDRYRVFRSVAVHDDEGWHPVPFVPWHQPFYNEAGLYHAKITLPCDQNTVTLLVSPTALSEGTKLATAVAAIVMADTPFSGATPAWAVFT